MEYIILRTVILTLIIVAIVYLFNQINELEKLLKDTVNEINKAKKLHRESMKAEFMGTITANNPEELFSEVKRITGLDIKSTVSEDVDEYGPNKERYINELTRMEATFDKTSTLQELISLFSLL